MGDEELSPGRKKSMSGASWPVVSMGLSEFSREGWERSKGCGYRKYRKGARLRKDMMGREGPRENGAAADEIRKRLSGHAREETASDDGTYVGGGGGQRKLGGCACLV
jgi:hypothetical protein